MAKPPNSVAKLVLLLPNIAKWCFQVKAFIYAHVHLLRIVFNVYPLQRTRGVHTVEVLVIGLQSAQNWKLCNKRMQARCQEGISWLNLLQITNTTTDN